MKKNLQKKLGELSLAEQGSKKAELAKALASFQLSMDASGLSSFGGAQSARRELKTLNRLAAIRATEQKGAAK